MSLSKGSPYPNSSNDQASPRPLLSHENSNRERDSRVTLSRYNSYDQCEPPVKAKSRYSDGPPSLQKSPTDSQENERTTNGHQQSPTNEDAPTNPPESITSPRRSKSDLSLSRKRSYRHSSEESDGGPKRQEDETAQRQKRKQPKIAAAYR